VAVTATVNPQFACFSLAVRPSRIHRFGVFAVEPIPARRKVIEYTGERINRRELKRRRARSFEYFFGLDKYWCIDGAVGGSGAEIINHSCAPNLFARRLRDRIFYFSKQPIAADEELTVDYRFTVPRPDVPCRCGAPTCRGTMSQKRPRGGGR
jgi:SET domain-containing protein